MSVPSRPTRPCRHPHVPPRRPRYGDGELRARRRAINEAQDAAFDSAIRTPASWETCAGGVGRWRGGRCTGRSRATADAGLAVGRRRCGQSLEKQAASEALSARQPAVMWTLADRDRRGRASDAGASTPTCTVPSATAAACDGSSACPRRYTHGGGERVRWSVNVAATFRKRSARERSGGGHPPGEAVPAPAGTASVSRAG
jgi:hypothetical protein